MPGTWGVTKQTEISALTAHGVTFTPFIRVTASEKKKLHVESKGCIRSHAAWESEGYIRSRATWESEG